MSEQKTQRMTPKQIAGGILMCLCGALAGYWWWSYSGPFRWIAERQLQWFGSYEESITFILTAAVAFAPLLVVGWAVKKLGFAAPAKPQTQPGESSWGMKWGHYAVSGFFLLIGLIVGGIGVSEYVRATRESRSTPFTLIDIEAGKKVDRLWVEVEGKPLLDLAGGMNSSGGERAYVPVVSENWKRGQPIWVYLEVAEHQMDATLKAPRGKYQGMVSLGGLPGMVREDFKRRGLMPAEGYVMIDYQEGPEKKLGGAYFLLVTGGAICLFAVGLLAYEKFRAGRIGPAKSGPVVAELKIKSIVSLNEPPRQP